MRIEIKGKEVTLISESRFEAMKLTALYMNNEAPQAEVKEQTPKRKVKEHKTHMFRKDCNVCGESGFRGNRGLALHKSVVHEIHSKNYEYNKKWQSVHRPTKKRKYQHSAEYLAKKNGAQIIQGSNEPMRIPVQSLA